MDNDLLPCPFCGGPVEFELTESIFPDPIHGFRKWYGVVCRNTENRGGTCAVSIRPSASKEAAIARWNSRTAQPAPAPVQTAPVDWNELTDLDRQQVFESLPDMLNGFLKTWGWVHFAKGIEQKCREKNSHPARPESNPKENQNDP